MVLFLAGKQIKVVQHSKCLGVAIDSNLSWDEHVKNASRTFSAKVNKLYNMRRLPKQTLSTIYFQGICRQSYTESLFGVIARRHFSTQSRRPTYVLLGLLTTSARRFQAKESSKKLHGNQSFTTTKDTWLVKHLKFTIISHRPS